MYVGSGDSSAASPSHTDSESQASAAPSVAASVADSHVSHDTHGHSDSVKHHGHEKHSASHGLSHGHGAHSSSHSHGHGGLSLRHSHSLGHEHGLGSGVAGHLDDDDVEHEEGNEDCECCGCIVVGLQIIVPTKEAEAAMKRAAAEIAVRYAAFLREKAASTEVPAPEKASLLKAATIVDARATSLVAEAKQLDSIVGTGQDHIRALTPHDARTHSHSHSHSSSHSTQHPHSRPQSHPHSHSHSHSHSHLQFDDQSHLGSRQHTSKDISASLQQQSSASLSRTPNSTTTSTGGRRRRITSLTRFDW